MGKTTTVVIKPNQLNISAQLIRAHLNIALAEAKRNSNLVALEAIDKILAEVSNLQSMVVDNPAKG